MSSAKCYLYRNLHRPGCFSVKYRGRVVDVHDCFIGNYVEFRVNSSGKKRVRKEMRKNVHAYAVSSSFLKVKTNLDIKSLNLKEVTYNPYKNDTFIWKSSGRPVDKKVMFAAFINGKVYASI